MDLVPGCARAGAQYAAISLDDDADASRLFLPLRRCEDGGQNVGFGSVIDRHGDSAMRCAHLPAALPPLGREQPGVADFQPRGMELAVGGYDSALAGLVTGGRVLPVPVGAVQRADDDVSARAGVCAASTAD